MNNADESGVAETSTVDDGYACRTIVINDVSRLHVREAATFLKRLRGLHALPPLGPNDALLIRPCRAVQTWRMRYAIDVVFLDTNCHILRVCPTVIGRSVSRKGAHAVLEMAAGAAERLELTVGQHLAGIAGSGVES